MNTSSDVFSVVLPSRMQADDLLAVGSQLHARYFAVLSAHTDDATVPPEGCPVGVAIPAAIATSHTRFTASLSALRATIVLRYERSDDAEAITPAKANVDSDRAWQTLHAWLGAWSMLADDDQNPTPADAVTLFGKLFPAPVGLRFINYRPRRQWTAMEHRMAVLTDPDVDTTIRALGGARVLANVTTTHETFGRTFGFTAALSANTAAPVVMIPQFSAAKDALRDYVAKVAVSADPDLPDSEALAAWLLRPFREMVAEFAAQPINRTKTATVPTPPA